MKKDLSHLPKHKQDELELIRDIILEKVPDVRMVVLFGSYARGDWVEDIHTEGHTTHVYESDFDILVATKSKKSAEDSDLHDRVEKTIAATNKVKTPCSIIYHTFSYVNHMIAEGSYFFTDIKKEGIHLYHTAKHNLGKVKLLTPEQRKQLAEEDFKLWFKKAKEFYDDFESNLSKKRNNKAAFELHQSVECFYSAITLVFINYRFRTHDIELLGIKAVSYDNEFAEVFPQTASHGRQATSDAIAFKLLKKAYVDARYKKDYKITKKQLEYLAERVKVLQKLTKKICAKKIESFV
jgi:predicted nucleotidyltransferase/HEPN domain-containing protein